MAKVIKIGGEEESEVVEKETEVVEAKDPIPDEEPPMIELDEFHIKQKFVKKVYYSIMLFLYLIICYFLALDIMLYYANEEYSILLLLFYILMVSIILPVFIIFLGFTPGGIIIGPILALTYGLMSLISRFIIKTVGLDVDLIFPELVGHVGVVRNPNALNKYTSYPLSVEIEKAGLYGNSFWHGNKIAACSSEEEIPVGTNVKVIEADYWSFGSLVRNSPVLKVVPFEGDTGLSLDDGTEGHEEVEPEVVDNVLDTEKVNEGMGLKSAANWTVRFVLVLTGIFFILFGLSVLMTCSMSSPPQCGTLIEASPCFSVSIICFILYFYLGRVE